METTRDWLLPALLTALLLTLWPVGALLSGDPAHPVEPVPGIVAAAATASARVGVAPDGPVGASASAYVEVAAAAAVGAGLLYAVLWAAGLAVRLRRRRVLGREDTALAAQVREAVAAVHRERRRIASGLHGTVRLRLPVAAA